MSKNGSISFFFLFFVVATNRHINLFIKLTPLLVGKNRPIKIHSCRLYLEGGDSLTPTCVTSKHHLIMIKTGLNLFAILLTCCGLKCAVFKRKLHHFETVNRRITSKKHPTFKTVEIGEFLAEESCFG